MRRLFGTLTIVLLSAGVAIAQGRDDRDDKAPLKSGYAVITPTGGTGLGGTEAGKVAASTSAVTRSATAGNFASSRFLQTRTESGGREIVTETIEVPGPDGAFKMFSEITTETVHVGLDSVQIKSDVFGTDSDGRRKLIRVTQADQAKSPDGSSQILENTWTVDLNGRLELSQRVLQEIKSGPNLKQTDVTIYRRGVNEDLRESERVQQTERQVSPNVVQNESSRFVRDSNGRWQTIEARNQEVRTAGATERIEVATIQRLDPNGALTPAERSVTRRSVANGQDQLVIETYSRNVGAAVSDPLALNQRLRVTTVGTADGGRQTIRELETRNPVAPNEPLGVVERTVETVRTIGRDRWEVQRQDFGLDGNGRLAPVITENGEVTGK
jgi:hypothetical protein